MFLPIGFGGNRQFCSNCHVLQQIILAVLSSCLASLWATVWDFASNCQSKAEAEWPPCSCSLLYSRVWQIQTQAWLSAPWSNGISWCDHKVLLATLCWVFMVSLKSTSKSLWWEQGSKMFDQKNYQVTYSSATLPSHNLLNGPFFKNRSNWVHKIWDHQNDINLSFKYCFICLYILKICVNMFLPRMDYCL